MAQPRALAAVAAAAAAASKVAVETWPAMRRLCCANSSSGSAAASASLARSRSAPLMAAWCKPKAGAGPATGALRGGLSVGAVASRASAGQGPFAGRRGYGTESLVKTEIVDDVAVVTLTAPEGNFPWGTRIAEHRINDALLGQLSSALDAAERKQVQALVVIGEGRFFCNGMDLQYISQHPSESTRLQTEAELLMSRILTLQVPTVAALNGHWTAAGAMLGLTFDVRLMPSDGRGLFFVPGIDIGLVYSKGMTELMKAKLPQPMWSDTLCFGCRFESADLLKHGVVAEAPAASELRGAALQAAERLKAKGKDQKTRETLHGIKRNLYQVAVETLGHNVEDMGFATGTWGPTGRPSKL